MSLFLRRLPVRIAIVAFWTGALFLFLFFSRLDFLWTKQKSIKIFTFPLLLDPQYLSKFEKRTGIKLYVHYYANNDELLAKMRSTKQHGYDIIFPTDYAVELLIRDGILEKIDKSRLAFLDKIYPQLLHLYYDPNNDYSIPFLWELYGIGFEKAHFGDSPPEATWGLLFDAKEAGSVGMLNNAREAVAIANLYLSGNPFCCNEKDLQEAKKLLLDQKNVVQMYTDLRADYLLTSGMCSVVACSSDEIWMYDDYQLEFLLPKEGSFLTVDNLCIPRGSKHSDDVYQFINHLYEHAVMDHHANTYAFFSALKSVPVESIQGREILADVLARFNELHFFKNYVSEEALREIWVALKAD